MTEKRKRGRPRTYFDSRDPFKAAAQRRQERRERESQLRAERASALKAATRLNLIPLRQYGRPMA